MNRLLALLVFVSLSSAALAWGEEGHRVVALVAQRELSQVSRAKLLEILKHHPDPTVRDLESASNWPDHIRDDPRYHHGSWHYLNLPCFVDGVERSVEIPKGALFALNLNTRRLKDSSLTPAERAVALCWVLHLIGDIHQPLHAANGYSQSFPKGDRGGKLFEVKMGTKPVSLHRYWDSACGLFWEGANSHRLPGIAAALAAERPNSAIDPKVWIEESHGLACEVVYPQARLGQSLQPENIARHRWLCQRRLSWAGHRTAAYLERVLAGRP